MIKTVNSNYIKVSPSKMRSPEKVMRLSRMGSSFQTRLSFIRSLTRRITREKWKFDKIRFDLDKDGYGVSVFSGLFVLFMMTLELLVAFLQAYVFTLLTAMYFGMAVEEH